MLQQIKLPYVRFTSDVKETRDAEGHIQRAMVYMAHITPAGGKDEVVKNAEEWLAELRRKGETRGPFDAAANEYSRWHEAFSKMFEQFKAGEELTTAGTPLRACLAFMKTEIAACEAARVLSLEDLAGANEEALQRIGIGARALKDKAAKLLEKQPNEKMAEEVAALRAENASLKERIEQFMAAGAGQQQSARGRKAHQAEAEAA